MSTRAAPRARRSSSWARRRGSTAVGSREPVLDALGRAGFVARGVVYLLIGWIALLIALDHRTGEADRSGALELIAGKPYGFAVLWFLVVGFAGMALWRLMLALRPQRADKSGAASRLTSAGKAVLYIVAAYTTARFTVTGHASASSNQQSADFTTDLMRHGGGRWLVGAIGIGLVVGGAVMIKGALEKRFAKELRTGSLSAAARRRVLLLGAVGKTARGVIVVGAGGFLVDAAVRFDPSRARGVDGTLRALAAAPFGSAVLIAMAVGLAAFGAYSFCEARWRRL
ncbi:hypothetical protein ABH920_007916 [Catenulispora sp. EB89]|uniref:DUF1206 domain-containing protein n=1 Tax=Catenulispora sp. EB89 TaxID=3156257 RepID=UPI00351915B1